MYTDYEAEQVILSDELKRKARNEWFNKKKTVGPATQKIWF